MNVGEGVQTVRRNITQETIDAYAVVSGDLNPIHIDVAFAAQTQLEGTIAHGMLVFGYFSDAMGRAYGRAWASTGRLKVRFRAPARPGDTLIVSGEVRAIEPGADGDATVRCALECRNESGAVLATGDASVIYRSDKQEPMQEKR